MGRGSNLLRLADFNQAVVLDAVRRSPGISRAELGRGSAPPGPVDVVAGVVVDPPQLQNWHTVRLRADLHELTGLPVLLDKDVTAAVTAELRAAPDRPGDFAFLYLGSGVGAGMVMNGQVLRGTTNNVGEVGDILVDPAAEDLDWPGRRGGLAAACVPEALVIQAAAAGILERPDLTDYVAVDDAFTALCALADAGNAAAGAIVDRSARRVAIGLGVIVNLLDVDRVVLGGPLWSRLRARYLAVLPELVTAEAVATRTPIRVEGSSVGDQIAAQGAAELVMEHFLGPRPSVLLMG